MAATLLSTALIARTVPPAVFGRYMLVIALVTICAQIADFGTTPVFAKQASEPHENYAAFWGSFLLVRAALAVPALAVAMIGVVVVQRDTAGALALASLSIPFVAARFFDPLYQVFGRPWFSTFTLGIYAVTTIVFNAAAALWHPTLGAFLGAYIGANILYVAAALGFAIRIVTPALRADRGLIARTVRLATPIGISALLTILNSRANLMFIEYWIGADALAVYGAAARILDLAVNLEILVLAPLIPVFSRLATNHDRLVAIYRQAFLSLLTLSLPVLVVCPYLSRPLMTTLFGFAYAGAAGVLNLLAAVGLLAAFALLNSFALLSLNVTRFALANTGTAVIVNLLLNALLVPRLGIAGAAWAQIGSELLLVAVTLIFVHHYLRGSLRPTDILPILLANAAAALVLHIGVPHLGLALVPVATLPLWFGRQLLRQAARLREASA